MITNVVGLEKFDVDLKDASKMFGKKFACGCSVTKGATGKDESVPKIKISAQELILDLLKERAETGRIYIMNIDHCNSHSSFKDKEEMIIFENHLAPSCLLQELNRYFAD